MNELLESLNAITAAFEFVSGQFKKQKLVRCISEIHGRT